MTDLEEPDSIGALPQRLHDSVDAFPRQSKHDLDAPTKDRVDEKNISGCRFHQNCGLLRPPLTGTSMLGGGIAEIFTF